MQRIFVSLALLIAAVGFAYVAVRLALLRIRTRAVVWLVIGLLWSGAITSIMFVDVNIPLSESHLRPNGPLAPLWLAFLAAVGRFAALASFVVIGPILRQRTPEPNQPVQVIATTDRAPDER
jgi:hypothetical protein